MQVFDAVGQVVRTYLRGWFTLDLLSILVSVFDFVELSADESSDISRYALAPGASASYASYASYSAVQLCTAVPTCICASYMYM